MKTIVITDVRSLQARALIPFLSARGYRVQVPPEGCHLWKEDEVRAFAAACPRPLAGVIHPAPPFLRFRRCPCDRRPQGLLPSAPGGLRSCRLPSSALRRRKLHIHSLPSRSCRKLSRSAAPPCPVRPASLGSAGRPLPLRPPPPGPSSASAADAPAGSATAALAPQQPWRPAPAFASAVLRCSASGQPAPQFPPSPGHSASSVNHPPLCCG